MGGSCGSGRVVGGGEWEEAGADERLVREDHPRFCRDFVADTHFEDGICHGFLGLSWKVSQLFCKFRNFRYLCIP